MIETLLNTPLPLPRLLQVLSKLCVCSPGAVLCVVDSLIDPLEKAITKSLPKEPSAASTAPAGPEADRASENVRSCVRVVLSVCGLEDVSLNRRWQDFIARLQKKPLVAEIMSEVQSRELRVEMGL